MDRFCCFLAAEAGAVWTGVESNKGECERNGTMMGLLRRVAAVLGLAALCWTTGCAGFWVYPGATNGSSTTPTNDYVYVANAYTTTTTTDDDAGRLRGGYRDADGGTGIALYAAVLSYGGGGESSQHHRLRCGQTARSLRMQSNRTVR